MPVQLRYGFCEGSTHPSPHKEINKIRYPIARKIMPWAAADQPCGPAPETRSTRSHVTMHTRPRPWRMGSCMPVQLRYGFCEGSTRPPPPTKKRKSENQIAIAPGKLCRRLTSPAARV
jgi:hypothetical protein